ncbi:MAG: flippase-like domain-containing protein [Rhodanobacteraceae bacterium]
MTLRAATWLAGALAVAATLIVPTALTGTAWLPALSRFPFNGTLAIGAVILGSWLAKGIKFRLLTAALGQSTGLATCVAVSLGCDLGFAATPGGVGGYPATIFLFDRVGVAPVCAAAIAAADQALDLVFFLVAVPLASLWLAAHGVSVWIRVSVSASLLLLAAVTLCALVLWRITRLRPGVLISVLARLPLLLRRRVLLARWWIELRAHLRTLRTASPLVLCTSLMMTVIQWVLRFAALGVALAWLGHPAPPIAVFLFQAVALHAGQWTGVPGGVGGADLILAKTLGGWSPVASLATALLIWRLATFHLTLLGGGVAFAALSARRSSTRTLLADAGT